MSMVANVFNNAGRNEKQQGMRQENKERGGKGEIEKGRGYRE